MTEAMTSARVDPNEAARTAGYKALLAAGYVVTISDRGIDLSRIPSADMAAAMGTFNYCPPVEIPTQYEVDDQTWRLSKGGN